MGEVTFAKDYWERVLRTFYTTAIGVGGPMVVLHLSQVMEDAAGGNWHALKSLGVTIGAAAVSAGWTACKGLVAKGLGYNPQDASLRGAVTNGH